MSLQFVVYIGMVSDIKNFANSQGWCTKIARRPNDLFQKEVSIHRSWVELQNLLADCHINLFRFGKQLPGGFTWIELFPGILLDSNLHFLLR